jgi:signal transduction histidine kinase
MSLAEAGRELVYLSVKDSGIGIPKDEQPRIFEKLHRASNAEALVPDGTGLGLYLVKTILDKVGGGISFESVEGKGTTFFVTIPFVWKASGDKPLAGA